MYQKEKTLLQEGIIVAEPATDISRRIGENETRYPLSAGHIASQAAKAQARAIACLASGDASFINVQPINGSDVQS
jgi:hypothetical protein